MSSHEVRLFPVPEPPAEEQEEIILRIDKLFNFADRIEARYKRRTRERIS